MTELSIPRRGIFRRRARAAEGSRPPRERGDSGRQFLVTLIAVLLLAAFLSPMLRSVAYSVKSLTQITAAHAPLYPADPVTFPYDGEELTIMNVPMPDGTTRQLALLEPLRRQSTFIDPAAPDAAPIVWQGSWRTLEPVWTVRAALRELRGGLGPHRLPAPAVQHRGHRRHLDHRHVAVVHASWPTDSPGSGSPVAGCCSRC